MIEERVDPSDRRAKLVSITEKGRKILFQCFRRLSKAGSILFDEVAEEDRKLCIQLLKKVEIKHAQKALEVKPRVSGKYLMSISTILIIAVVNFIGHCLSVFYWLSVFGHDG